MIKGPNQLDERVPIDVDGIQVNFCKNPQCPNFGAPASTKRQPRESTPHGKNEAVVPGSEGLADKTPNDKGEDGTGG